ncbi:hypothetical protein RFI_29147 [Reticulomyxa filosa]|uniref:Uncharacterized protein n=1 Tax=Reticulomyxa filosa TaxID=46433 RepID=X6M441_RETFI|nr:hypothetical protein RFI_29147 [Reticulomyxa filosa]|eukprot:ETO08242.1 hypothetical protein RFI_29147 [Reticulomyxa filosa]
MSIDCPKSRKQPIICDSVTRYNIADVAKRNVLLCSCQRRIAGMTVPLFDMSLLIFKKNEIYNINNPTEIFSKSFSKTLCYRSSLSNSLAKIKGCYLFFLLHVDSVLFSESYCVSAFSSQFFFFFFVCTIYFTMNNFNKQKKQQGAITQHSFHFKDIVQMFRQFLIKFVDPNQNYNFLNESFAVGSRHVFSLFFWRGSELCALNMSRCFNYAPKGAHCHQLHIPITNYCGAIYKVRSNYDGFQVNTVQHQMGTTAIITISPTITTPPTALHHNHTNHKYSKQIKFIHISVTFDIPFFQLRKQTKKRVRKKFDKNN